MDRFKVNMQQMYKIFTLKGLHNFPDEGHFLHNKNVNFIEFNK